MFGDSGRRVVAEDGSLCAPAGATDPAAATVAVLRKFLRSMKTSIQEILTHIDADETAAIRSLEDHCNEFRGSEN
jgi:hypothetical protein